MYLFADESPLTRPEILALDAPRHLVQTCAVQAEDPFDELAKLINGGGHAGGQQRTGGMPQAAAPASPSQTYRQPAAPDWQAPQAAPAAPEPDAAPEPSFDLGQMRRAISDIPAPRPTSAYYGAAQDPMQSAAPVTMAPVSRAPAPAPETLPDLSQFEAQLASLMALPQETEPQETEPQETEPQPTVPAWHPEMEMHPAAPAWQPEPPIAHDPAPAATVPAYVPPSFDPSALAMPSVPETEMPQVVQDSIPSMREMEFALGSELEAALDSDFGSVSADAPASPSEAVGIPTALMAAAAEREFPTEPTFVPEVAPVIPPPVPRRGRSRAIMAGLASLALFGGTAAIAWNVLGPVDGDEVPVILASTEAAKDKPADAGGAKIPNRDVALFNEKSGASHQTALRRGSEAPLPVTTVRTTKTVRVSPTVRVNPSVQTEPANSRRLTTRKVRTVVVKPDGTIVTADVKAPDVFATEAPRIRTVRARPVTTAGVGEAKRALPKPATSSVEQPRVVSSRPVASPPAAPAPAPVEVARVERAPAAPLRTTTAPSAVELAPATHDGYVVQISSRRTPESAQKAFRKLQGQFTGLLADRRAEYQRKDIEGRGTFYRVRVIAESKNDARNLCRSLKKAGGSCFVSR